MGATADHLNQDTAPDTWASRPAEAWREHEEDQRSTEAHHAGASERARKDAETLALVAKGREGHRGVVSAAAQLADEMREGAASPAAADMLQGIADYIQSLEGIVWPERKAAA